MGQMYTKVGVVVGSAELVPLFFCYSTLN